MTKRWTPAIHIAAPTALLALSLGCSGDDNLGKGFVPGDGDADQSTAPPFPIAAGATFQWSFSKTYDPSIVSSGTANEKTAAGALCLRVTDVHDNFEADTDTRLAAMTRLTDPSGVGDVFFEDQNDEAATAEAVDAKHRGLWLAAALPPTRGHGLSVAVSRSYGTRRALVPPTTLEGALLFDPREHPGGGWDGWGSYAAAFVAWFRDAFGAGYATSDDLYVAPPRSAYGCAEQTTAGDCSTLGQGCVWDGFSCTGLFGLEATWREVAPSDAPAELADNQVMHHIKIEINENGSLRLVSEYLRLDEHAGEPVSQVASAYRECGAAGTPCAWATLALDASPWGASTPCAF